MRATRRNVLVILGVLTIAGGALFGTGAFTQVQADRSVQVNTAGDSSALLTMDVSGDLEGSNDDTIAFQQDDINLDAKTYFNESFTVTNTGGDSVELDVTDDGTSLLHKNDNYDSANMYFVSNRSSGGSTVTLPADGGTVEFDVAFDTTGTTSNSSASFPDDITVVAN